MSDRSNVLRPPALSGSGTLEPALSGDWIGPDHSGQTSLVIPLPLSRADGAPDVSLVYRHSSTDGVFGLGWRLSLPSLRRESDRGLPTFTDEDRVLAPDGEPLLLVENSTASSFRGIALGATYDVRRFRPRTERDHTRFERWTGAGDDFWMLHSPDGTLHVFGRHANARLADPASPSHVAEWRLEESIGSHGERVAYVYTAEDASGAPEDGRDTTAARYLTHIRYGNANATDLPLCLVDATDDAWRFELVLDYGQRTLSVDEVPGYAADHEWPSREHPIADAHYGFEHRQFRLCRQFLMFHRFSELGEQPVLVRRMLLHYAPTERHARVCRVDRFAYGLSGIPERAAPMTFDWTTFDATQGGDRESPPFPGTAASGSAFLDALGEGVPGVVWQATTGRLFAEPVRAEDGDADAIAYAPLRPLPMPALSRPGTSPGRFYGGGPWHSIDISQDGRADWVTSFGPIHGFHAAAGLARWEAFRPFSHAPTEGDTAFAWWVDIDRTGRGAYVTVHPNGIRVVPLEDDGGFGAPRFVDHAGERLPAAGGTDIVAFGPMLCAGANDLVRVAPDGTVDAWGDRGGGAFAPRHRPGALTTDRPLIARHTHLVDIDGDGWVDIVHATVEGLVIWLNRGGHGFTDPVVRPWPAGVLFDDGCSLGFSDVDARGGMTAILAVPARGGRTACEWRMDIGMPFPWRLYRTNNHRGAVTSVTLRRSAQEWLDAKRDGASAGSSLLPYSVDIVKRVDVVDDVSGLHYRRTMTYRDGYHDASDRTFAGFRRVDTVQECDPPSEHWPSRRLVAWYHVGCDELDTDESDFALDLPCPLRLRPDRPPEENAASWRRSLRGRERRRELYAPGASDAGPWYVAHSRHAVRRVADTVREALLVETASDLLAGNREEPMRRHELFLDHDAFGIARRTLSIGCARPPGHAPADPDEIAPWRDSRDDQQGMHTLTETLVMPWHVDAPGRWRLAVEGDRRVQRVVVGPDMLAMADICLEWFESPSCPVDTLPRALVSLTCVHFGDTNTDVPPDAAALPMAVSSAAMDAAARRELADAAGTDRADALLAKGGFTPMHSRLLAPDDDLLGVVTSRMVYDDFQGFHRILRRSPAASIGWTTYAYDRHGLFVAQVTDPLGWNITIDTDYRRLLPWRTVDADGVTRAIAMDAFGAVRAETLHGRELDTAGVAIDTGFAAISGPDATPGSSVTDAIDDPEAALRGHARAWVANDASWNDASADRQPAHVLQIAAADFPAAATAAAPRLTVTHFDGIGRPIGSRIRTRVGTWAVTRHIVPPPEGPASTSFLPYVSDDWRFADPPPNTPTKHVTSDVLGRVTVATRADGALRRQRHRPWYAITDDENCMTTGHDTPSEPRVSSWQPDGSPARTVRYLRDKGNDTPAASIERVVFAENGRAIEAFDARMAVPARRWSSALGGVRHWSADAGDAWSLTGDAGQHLWSRDATGSQVIYDYDDAGRFVRGTVDADGEQRVALRQWWAPPSTGTDGRNLASFPVRVYDDAGCTATVRASIFGVPIETRQRLLADDEDADWADGPDIDARLEAREAITTVIPRGDGATSVFIDAAGHRREYTYGDTGDILAVNFVAGTGTRHVLATSIERDAAGRIVRMGVGPHLTRDWRYDEATGNMLHSETRSADGTVIQATDYAYDPVGNLVRLVDDGETRTFSYDSGYRLVRATGREHPDAADDGSLPPLLATGNASETRTYVRTHVYDPGDNLLEVEHAPAEGTTRRATMIVSPTSNRTVPAQMGVPAEDVDTCFDAAGRLLRSWPGLSALRWNTLGRLRRVDVGTAQGDGETYRYDANHRRRRKRWTYAGNGGESLYHPGVRCDDEGGSRRETIAMAVGMARFRVTHSQGVTSVTHELGAPCVAGSLLVTDDGAVLRREAYYPYGGVALRMAPPGTDTTGLDLHYAGVQRDGTSLYDYGRRHYLCWQARWCAPDPSGDVDGLNRYAMVRGNPMTFTDEGGLTGVPAYADDTSFRHADDHDPDDHTFIESPAVQAGREKFVEMAAAFIKPYLRTNKARAELKTYTALAGYYVPPGEIALPTDHLAGIVGKRHAWRVEGSPTQPPGFGRTGFVNLPARVWNSVTNASFPGTTPLTFGAVAGNRVVFDPEIQGRPHPGAIEPAVASQYYVNDSDGLVAAIEEVRAKGMPAPKQVGSEAANAAPSTPPPLHSNLERVLRSFIDVHRPVPRADGTHDVRPHRRDDSIPGLHAETLATSAVHHAVSDYGTARAVIFTIKLGPLSNGDAAKWTMDELKAQIRSATFDACYHCDSLIRPDAGIESGAIGHVATGRARLGTGRQTFLDNHVPLVPQDNPIGRRTSNMPTPASQPGTPAEPPLTRGQGHKAPALSAPVSVAPTAPATPPALMIAGAPEPALSPAWVTRELQAFHRVMGPTGPEHALPQHPFAHDQTQEQRNAIGRLTRALANLQRNLPQSRARNQIPRGPTSSW
ncbi:RHS repeat-associated core domain-containing protein [Luteibacter sp. UNC138MFCol5.1]|uniref:SpvB/TcaC N-terminal domain-containing protein n=1 Tax=Luteibacter sp. UNC138MFCol5.1 TaxID=1502774 RepID=UPI0008C58CB0|nr:SpvB/TcaC N-terminal domain-containing protein [Luteibacter sp. UNC138MFCol5.1]SEO98242.1 RHS repeat-associated core domain-containing protein [Luteibacter sp. UNC138MFCol5.1]